MQDGMTEDASDRDLALAAAGGARAALGVLLDRHYDRIYRLSWRLTGSRTDAEDVTQEVCIKLATAIRSFRGESEVSTWIWRIAHNAATDVLRQRQRISVLAPAEMMALVDREDLVSPKVEHVDGGEQLWAAVRKLSGQQQEAVLLVYGEEKSHAEAAGVMGCSEKTVSWHLHEARKRLKKLLAAPPDGQGANSVQAAPLHPQASKAGLEP